jgi:methyl-accepting chemotaxis protein
MNFRRMLGKPKLPRRLPKFKLPRKLPRFKPPTSMRALGLRRLNFLAGRSVAVRLSAGFLIVLLCTGLIGWAALNAAKSVNRTTEAITERGIDEVAELSEMRQLADRNRHLGLEYSIAPDAADRTSLHTVMRFQDRQLEEFFKEELEHAHHDETVHTAIESLSVVYKAYVSERENGIIFQAAASDPSLARQAALTTVDHRFRVVESGFFNLHSLLEHEAQALTKDGDAALAAGRSRVIGTLILAVFLGLGIAFLLARRIARSMSKVAEAATGLADGDLTRRADVKTGDEIETMAVAFNQMADRLQAMVANDRVIKESLEKAVADYSSFAEAVARGDLTVRVSTNGSSELTELTENLNGMVSSLGNLSAEVDASAMSVGSAAMQILATVSEQSATVTQQSAAINQTSVTVDELRASAEQAALKAQEVAAQAQTSVQVSSDGTEVVEDIVTRMEEIRARVEAIAQNILTLSEQTQQISELTATVDDIAEQSNLLALNATIEAARAGEQGRGFAVVAAEVRNLAEQSKQGTAQVRNILTDIQKATNAAVMATEQGIKVVEDGRTLGRRAGDAISQLAMTIRETAQSAQQISATAQQQSLAIDQISESMQDINGAAGQFVSGVEESKSSAEVLNELAQALQSLTATYKVEVN